MSTKVRIVGVGSPHGDDQAGWCVVDRLSERRELTGTDIGAVKIHDAADLLDSLNQSDVLILVDGCVSGQLPGTVTRMTWPDPRIRERHTRSSHGMDVGSVLQLAGTLGQLPQKVVLFGIEVESCQPSADLSRAVCRALSGLEHQVLEEATAAAARGQNGPMPVGPGRRTGP